MADSVHAGRGKSPLDQRIIDSKLEARGLHVDTESRIISEPERLPAGTDRVDLDNIDSIPMSIGSRLAQSLKAPQARWVARGTMAGAISAVSTLGVSMAVAGKDPSDRARLSRDLSRLGHRLIRASGDLDSALEKSVLAHARPQEIEALRTAYERFLASARQHGDRLLILSELEPALGRAVREGMLRLLHRHREFIPHEGPVPEVLRIPPEQWATLAETLRQCAAPEAVRDGVSALLGSIHYGQLAPNEKTWTLEILSRIPAHGGELAAILASSYFQALSSEMRAPYLAFMAEAAQIEPGAFPAAFRFLNRLGPERDPFFEAILKKDIAGAISHVAAFAAQNHHVGLDPEVGASLVAALARHGSDDEARRVLAELARAAAIGGLSNEEQLRLLRYASGRNTQLSAPAREYFSKRLQAIGSGTPKSIGGDLRSFLAHQPSLPFHPPVGRAFERARSSVTMGPLAPCRMPTGEGHKTVLRVQNHPIHVRATVEAVEGGLSIDDIRDAVSRLPWWSARVLTSVSCFPWGRTGKNGATTHMSCAHYSGSVSTYVDKAGWKREDVAADLLHESAHQIAYRAYGEGLDEKGWDRWREVVQKDGVLPCGYGRTDLHEDFAEAATLYAVVVGTKDEAELRALMPHRFAEIERALAEEEQRWNAAHAAFAERRPLMEQVSSEAAAVLTEAFEIRPQRSGVVDLIEHLPAIDPSLQRLIADVALQYALFAPARFEALRRLLEVRGFAEMPLPEQRDLVRMLAPVRFVATRGMHQNLRLGLLNPPPLTVEKLREYVRGSNRRRALYFAKDMMHVTPFGFVPDLTKLTESIQARVDHHRFTACSGMQTLGGHPIRLSMPEALRKERGFDSAARAVLRLPTLTLPYIKGVQLAFYYGGDTFAQTSDGVISVGWPYRDNALADPDLGRRLQFAAWRTLEERGLTPTERAEWNEIHRVDWLEAAGPEPSWTASSPFAAAAMTYAAVRGWDEEARFRLALPRQFEFLDRLFARLEAEARTKADDDEAPAPPSGEMAQETRGRTTNADVGCRS